MTPIDPGERIVLSEPKPPWRGRVWPAALIIVVLAAGVGGAIGIAVWQGMPIGRTAAKVKVASTGRERPLHATASTGASGCQHWDAAARVMQLAAAMTEITDPALRGAAKRAYVTAFGDYLIAGECRLFMPGEELIGEPLYPGLLRVRSADSSVSYMAPEVFFCWTDEPGCPR